MYLKHVAKDGSTRLVEHRVWDAERFFTRISEDATREGGRVEMSSLEAYRAARWPNRSAS